MARLTRKTSSGMSRVTGQVPADEKTPASALEREPLVTDGTVDYVSLHIGPGPIANRIGMVFVAETFERYGGMLRTRNEILVEADGEIVQLTSDSIDSVN